MDPFTVGENDREIAGLENARVLIRAAYEAEENAILHTTQGSPIFELGDNFVIAALTQVTEEGIAPLDDVRPRVELAVTKEKKAALLVEKAKAALVDNTGLAEVASPLDTEIQSANGINFNSF